MTAADTLWRNGSARPTRPRSEIAKVASHHDRHRY